MATKGGDDVLEDLTVKIGVEVDEASQAKADKAQQAAGSKAVAIGNLISGGIQKAAALAVDALQRITGAVVDAVEGFAEYGGEIDDTAKKSGVAAGDLQRLRYAAKMSGVEASALTSGLRKLQDGLVEARAKGSGPFADALKGLGLRLSDLEGLSTTEQFGVLADRIASITDPAERTAAAMDLFGKSGAELLPLLLEGGGGIEALTKRAEELGIVLSDDAIANAAELGDTLDDLKAVIGAAAGQVGQALAPVVTDMAGRMTDWIAENGDFIRQDLPAAIASIIEVGGDLLAWIADTITEFRQFGKLIADTADDATALADSLADDLEPAISAVTTAAEAWAEAFTTINEAIGTGIAEVLDYIGVLDTLKSAWDSLPFTGESIDEMTARLHGGGLMDYVRRATGTGGGPSTAGFNEDGSAPHVSGTATGGGRAGAARESVRIATTAANTLAEVNRIMARGVEAAQRAAKGGTRYRPPTKGGGGKGKADGPSSKEMFAGAWAALTGEREPTFMESLASSLGLGGMGPRSVERTGSGTSPIAGATFNRVDASFTQHNTFTLQLPAEMATAGGREQGANLAHQIADQLNALNRPVFDHYRQVLRSL